MYLFCINHRTHPHRSLAVLTALVMIGAVVIGGVPPATAQIDDDDDGYPYSGSYTYPSSSRMPDLDRRYTDIERSARGITRERGGDDLAGALIEGAIGLLGRGIHRRMGGKDAPVRLVPHLPPSGQPRSDRGFSRERPLSGGDSISARCWRHPQLRRRPESRTPAGDRFVPGVRAPRLKPATGSGPPPWSDPWHAGSSPYQTDQKGTSLEGGWTCVFVPPGAETSEAW